MLLCNNTAIPELCRINRVRIAGEAGRVAAHRRIIAGMDDADDLARRYFALWAEYLTALASDPQAAMLLQRWVQFTSQFASPLAGASGERAGNPFAAWPPVPAGAATAGVRSTDGPETPAAAAAGASRQRDVAVGELARRVDELERRLAAVERQPQARGPRRRDRASGK